MDQLLFESLRMWELLKKERLRGQTSSLCTPPWPEPLTEKTFSSIQHTRKSGVVLRALIAVFGRLRQADLGSKGSLRLNKPTNNPLPWEHLKAFFFVCMSVWLACVPSPCAGLKRVLDLL